VVKISGLTGKHMDDLYEAIAKHSR
jgi:hypothetical protein